MIVRCSDFNVIREHTAITDGYTGTIHYINACVVQNKNTISNFDAVVISFKNQLQTVQVAVIANNQGISLPLEANICIM